MDILIAEDDPVSRIRLQRVLESFGYRVTAVENGAHAWEAFDRAEGLMVAILDWMMPDIDGIELCRRLKSDPDKRYHYVIMLTVKNRTDDIVGAMDAGADDFISKPFNADELKVRVRAAARIVRLQEELLFKANYDGLTGTFSRRMIMDMLAREAKRAQRTGASLTVAMLDIDYFKRINDRYGHSAGDAVLQVVSQRVVKELRATDLVGRYGGEEFVLILPDCALAAAVEVAERLRQAIRSVPVESGGEWVNVTASIGLAASSSSAESPLDGQAMLDSADRALYRAKEGGRDRVQS
jgi:two-component system cell cycle response regulator